MSIDRVAAIWCRVSRPDQGELSPDTQEATVKRVLEAQGYRIPPEHIVKVNWTSLDLMACPEFRKLRQWIANGEVQAIGVLDRDRLQAQGLQRLIFLSECKERGVEVITAQGPPILDGAEGQLLERALAFGKEKSVIRAQTGSRDGLRDRALLRRLPAIPKSFYGYRWDGARLVPDESYLMAQGIWRMLVAGKMDRAIAGIMTRAAIPTPPGGNLWLPRTIAFIASHPGYCDRYTSLRFEVIEPKTRRGQTYGKTGKRKRRPEETVVLEGLVEQPVVTPEEFEMVQARRARNKALGGRRTRTYMLSGLVRCGLCGRAYTGTVIKGRRIPYGYRCNRANAPVGWPRCRWRLMPGPWLEEAVWGEVRAFLEKPQVFLGEVGKQEAHRQETAEAIRETITGLERRKAQYVGYRQRAYDGLVRGMTDEETYHRVVAGYRAHEMWLEEELTRQIRDLEQAERKALDAESVRHLYGALRERLERATDQDKRFVLETLATDVTVASDAITLELSVPERVVETVGSIPRSSMR